jgi:hypothetical protein
MRLSRISFDSILDLLKPISPSTFLKSSLSPPSRPSTSELPTSPILSFPPSSSPRPTFDILISNITLQRNTRLYWEEPCRSLYIPASSLLRLETLKISVNSESLPRLVAELFLGRDQSRRSGDDSGGIKQVGEARVIRSMERGRCCSLGLSPLGSELV